MIVESREPHGANGSRCPTYQANPVRWAEVTSKFGSKIHYEVLDKLEPVYTDKKSGWERENFHRNALMQPILQLCDVPTDVVIISDVDEIPRASALKFRIQHLKDLPFYLSLDMFMFNVNSLLNEPWRMSYVATVKTLLEAGGTQAPRGHLDCPKPSGIYSVINDAGWHFSSFMDMPRLREKLLK